jgi:hypothetical protein
MQQPAAGTTPPPLPGAAAAAAAPPSTSSPRPRSPNHSACPRPMCIATLEAGELKGKKIGSSWRVTRAALDAYLAE